VQHVQGRPVLLLRGQGRAHRGDLRPLGRYARELHRGRGGRCGVIDGVDPGSRARLRARNSRGWSAFVRHEPRAAQRQSG